MHNISLLILIALCACTTTYNKPGGTEAEFKKDYYECQRDAHMAGGAYAMAGGLIQSTAVQSTREQCMESKGYTKQ